MTSNLVTLVRQQKALARRNQTVRNGVFLLGVLAGLVVAIVWFALAPVEGPKPQTKFLIGIALGAMLGVFVLGVHDSSLFPNKAACPTCGHSWEIQEGRGVPVMAQMPNWDKCPGCGMLMNEVLLEKRL